VKMVGLGSQMSVSVTVSQLLIFEIRSVPNEIEKFLAFHWLQLVPVHRRRACFQVPVMEVCASVT
jgi:hypothetical protein